MPLFSDMIEHGSTSVDATSCEINRARSVTVDSQQETSRKNHSGDASRRTSDASSVPLGVSVQLRNVWLGCWCHAPARDLRESYGK